MVRGTSFSGTTLFSDGGGGREEHIESVPLGNIISSSWVIVRIENKHLKRALVYVSATSHTQSTTNSSRDSFREEWNDMYVYNPILGTLFLTALHINFNIKRDAPRFSFFGGSRSWCRHP